MMKLLDTYNVCFLGKTGYGKSSLINAMFGTKFSTDPFYSCTKELYSVSLMNIHPKNKECVTVYDTPGIGEFPDDDIYYRYYEHAVSIANCVVLVVTFEKTDAPEQELLMNLKPFVNLDKKVKFIIALNHIDSTVVAMDKDYEPWNNVDNIPTKQCQAIIKERIKIIHQKFDGVFMIPEIIPVCAVRKYGIDKLKKCIINK